MAEKKTDDFLLALLAACPPPGSLYRHYKTGSVYIVAGAAIAEATQVALVLYRQVFSGVTFARPLAEWDESVEYDGAMVRRFTRIEG